MEATPRGLDSTLAPSDRRPALGIGHDDPSERRQRRKSARQQLSCKKCKERKVKCDRTFPCSSCCARGQPSECVFEYEGSFTPISQGDEIRRLRKENERLRAFIIEAGLDPTKGETGNIQAQKSAKHTLTRQRLFRTVERVDNLYFGSPGLVNVISDFGNVQVGQSLIHALPEERGFYTQTSEPSAYPFPTLWQSKDASKKMVRDLLNSHEFVYECLDSFERRSHVSCFPHVSEELTRAEFGRFLEDAETNAEKHPDMLALMFATIASGLQMGVWDRGRERWELPTVVEARQKGDVYIAAAMEALRQGSFSSTPTLLAIQSLVIMGPYLTNSSRYLDAFTLFGTTIRCAHLIGLHRNPQLLNPPLDSRESMMRRSLWWWLLHMDQQYAIMLGRPLGISGIGDCPPPELLTSSPTKLRISEFVHHLTILSRQILSSDALTSVVNIDLFTDKLVTLWDTMPESLKFNEAWLRPDQTLPDWPLNVMSATLFAKVQSLVICLNRQREHAQETPKPPSNKRRRTDSLSMPEPGPAPHPYPYFSNQPPTKQPPKRGKRLMIESSINLLWAFLFLHRRYPGALMCWTMGQQAFSACMILALDACETGHGVNVWIIGEANEVFNELQSKNVHTLARPAYNRIRKVLEHFQMLEEQRATLETTELHIAPPTDAMNQNHGILLLEDHGLQSPLPAQFRPLGWVMAGAQGEPASSNSATAGGFVPTSVADSQQFTAFVSPMDAPRTSVGFSPSTASATYCPGPMGSPVQQQQPPQHFAMMPSLAIPAISQHHMSRYGKSMDSAMPECTDEGGSIVRRHSDVGPYKAVMGRQSPMQ